MPFETGIKLPFSDSTAIMEKKAAEYNLPDDFGISRHSFELPDDSGQMRQHDVQVGKTRFFESLNDMKRELGMSYSEIKADKPPHSPNLAKWFDAGGSVQAGEKGGHPAWTFQDCAGRAVTYLDGYPIFPPEAKHPVIGDINIGRFTGDRAEDKQLYTKKLLEEYGLAEIPSGYALHHDCKNGNMQLVEIGWHGTFTHTGGHSRFKETE